MCIRNAKTRMWCCRSQRPGFTLIEVLVVVAIIALLISILLPSLREAREQAKLVVDQANCKQIATMNSLYQADFKGKVPVMLSYVGEEDTHAKTQNKNINGQDTLPARTGLLSLPLRRYTQDRRTLPPEFNPEEYWLPEKIDSYERSKLLSDYFVCPFTRAKQKQEKPQYEWITVKGPTTSVAYQHREPEGGRSESYRTWGWPRCIIRNERPYYATAPNSQEPAHPNEAYMDGLPKYSTLTWNNRWNVYNPGGYDNKSLKLKDSHRDWANDARDKRLRSGGLSELTVLYCGLGQHMGLEQKYYNIGSHRRNGVGGTNVVFADTHVEWVKGTRVGW